MMRILVVAAALVGCGGGDKCEKAYAKMIAMDKGGAPDKAKAIQQCKDDLKAHPEHAKMLDCIAGLPDKPTQEDAMKCLASAKDEVDDYKNKSRATEASLQLNKLGKKAKSAFVETGEFPKGKVGPTPAGPCCKGEKGKCAVDAKAWQDPAWQALEFSIDEPSLYQYSYESDGKTFTALAVGDLDCDSNSATYTLKGTVDNGNPSVNLEMPPKGTY